MHTSHRRHELRGGHPAVPGVLQAAGGGAEDHPHPGGLVAPVLRAGAGHLQQRGRRLHPGHLRHHAQH